MDYPFNATVCYDIWSISYIHTITDVCFTLCGAGSLWCHGVSASALTARSTQMVSPSSVWKNSTGLQRTMTSTPSNHGRINLLEGPRGRKLLLSLHWSLHPSISCPLCAADALSALDFHQMWVFFYREVSVCDWIKIIFENLDQIIVQVEARGSSGSCQHQTLSPSIS